MATAQATCPSRIAIITRKSYTHLKACHPNIATNLLQYLIIAADDLACQLMKRLSESQAYIYANTHAKRAG